MLQAAIRQVTIASVALACAGAAPKARAQEASAWNAEPHAAARLIAGAALKSAEAAWLRAGIEIRLDNGWKTYWRYPGDSGMPPTLDFGGSENVKSVTVLWPAPERFADGAGGQSIGYRGDVVFPLRIAPKDPAEPSLLRVKLVYAICGNLCVPAEAKLYLKLSGKGGAEEAALVAAEARVPRRIALGDAAPGTGLAIRSVHRERGGGHEHIMVEVAAPASALVDLFVEGPTPNWALPLPKPSGGAPGIRRFTLDLDGVPPGTPADGATLTWTAVSADDAIEVAAHLD
ncbi:MAG TPA: protein-disulfide reductase DsbD domain-containing protein [Xanthobacteraceae bacterium]|nr:protein-disulfide reductase DsbD domain-containing protein [Xanthobacteraceae bacterium]